MNRVSSLTGVLVLVASIGAYAQQIDVTARAGSSGDVALEWNGLAANYGYAVLGTTALDGGAWRYAAPVDQWPVPQTSCTLAADDSIAYLRVKATNRGRLVSSSVMHSMTSAQINLMLFFAGQPQTATSDVTIYKLVYETFDYRGLSTLASGAFAVPTTPGAGSTGPLASLQNGTVFLKSDAPSEGNQEDHALAYVMAGEEYIVSIPDYLGLGLTSPGLHPYVHGRSAAVAAVDMLRAAKAFLTGAGRIQPSGKLFLAGYSEGGHATMALHRELERYHASEFPVTACAPMAGPYDMSGTMADIIIGDESYEGREYIPYQLFAYDAIYDLYDAVSDVLLTTPTNCAAILPPLFDGLHGSGEVDAAMPRVPRDIFRSEWITDFENNPANPMRVQLEANDVYRDWVPQAPMHLYHCSGDEVVPYANSEAARDSFNARGGSVVLTDMGPTLSHSEGLEPCSQAAKAWFDSLR